MGVKGQSQSKKKHERKRDARQKLQEEHGGRNRCRTQNPPGAARIAIKNSHILTTKNPSDLRIERKTKINKRETSSVSLSLMSIHMSVLRGFSHIRLCDPMDYSPPGSSVHWILQERILKWVSMPASGRSSQLRD